MLPCITKDCEVKVSDKKDGFKGAWYRAILEENPTKSGHKLLRVRYKTLLKEDGSTPLTEIVDQSFVRPLPPKDPNENGSVFKEGSEVDAYYKDGWWTGRVVKRKEENDTYLVYFDFLLPDIIPFERKQLRAHLDWTGYKWVRPRPEKTESLKPVFSSGTMVELGEVDLVWCPAMIIKALENEKSFIVKYCDHKEESRIKIVDSRKVRPWQPHFAVGKYELLDHIEAFNGSVWRRGVVRGILTLEERYILKPKTGKESPSGGRYYARKRKRGQVGHNPDLSDTSLSSDRTPTVVKNSHANVEDTTMVSPFAKKSPIWKTYETMEVFKTLPQSPHFSKLSEIRQDFREGYALGVMATFSGLLEKFKDLEADVPISQLDSLKDSFTELEKHGFDVTRPLLRIEKLLALKDRQLNILKKRKDFDKNIIVEKRKSEHEFGKMERKMLEVKQKILGLQRQEAALKELKEAAKKQKDAAYKNICHLESCARDLGVELEDVEFDFETILSAPW